MGWDELKLPLGGDCFHDLFGLSLHQVLVGILQVLFDTVELCETHLVDFGKGLEDSKLLFVIVEFTHEVVDLFGVLLGEDQEVGLDGDCHPQRELVGDRLFDLSCLLGIFSNEDVFDITAELLDFLKLKVTQEVLTLAEFELDLVLD